MTYFLLVLTTLFFSHSLWSINWQTQNIISTSTETKQGLKVVGNTRGDTVAIWMETAGSNPGIYVAYSPPTQNNWTSIQKISTKTSVYNPSVCLNNLGQGFVTYAEDENPLTSTQLSSLYKMNFTINDNTIAFGNETSVNSYFTISTPQANQATPITQINNQGDCLVFSIGHVGLGLVYGPFQEGPFPYFKQLTTYVGVGSPPSNQFTRFNINQSQNGNIVGIWNGGSGGSIVKSKVSITYPPILSDPISVTTTNNYYGFSGPPIADIDNNGNVAAFANYICAGTTPNSTASGWRLYFGDSTGYNNIPSLDINYSINSFLNPPAMEVNTYGFGGCIFSSADDQLNSFSINTENQTAGDIIPFATGTNPAVSTDAVQNLYATWIDNTTGYAAGGIFTESSQTWDSIQTISTTAVSTTAGTANFSNLSIAATKVGYGVVVFIGSDNKVYSVFFENPDAPNSPFAFFKTNELYNPTFFQKGVQ